MSAPTASGRRSPSLGARTFLVAALPVVVAILIAVVATALVGERLAHRSLSRALAATQLAQATFQQQRYQQLQLIGRILAGDAHLVAYIAQAAQLVETRSILDILYERQQELGCEFLMALDARGGLLARTDRPDETGTDLAPQPLVAEAQAEHEAAGVWRESGRLHDAVVVPLAKDLDLAGYLVVGFAIDDALARATGRVSGTDVVYLAWEGERPAAVASTLEPGPTAAIVAAIAARSPSARSAGEMAPVDLDIDGHTWVALAHPLPGGPGGGMIVALAPLDAALESHRQIVGILLVVGLVALLLALGLSYALSQRLVRPIRRLVHAAGAARAGEYDQRVAAEGADEVADLARAFDSLLADLRERRDMETFLGDLARSLPEEVGAGTASTLPVQPPATAARSATFAPGAVLGQRYEILSTLGMGGMGVVYKAFDRQLSEVVALKTLRAETLRDPEPLERLKDELKLARRITHPNVLRTHDFAVLDGVPCISMEFVPGITLRQLLLRSGRLPYSAGLHLARQMGAGLAAAHAEGIVHRDLKPENLILQPNGNAKLADFGIARLLHRPGPARDAALVVGTPSYLAPEQLRGEEPTPRTDLYALGVVLYEIFTGRLPFTGGTAIEILRQHLETAPEPPSRHWPAMPPALERIILRCLEKEPARRHARVEQLLAELDALRSEAPAAIRAGIPAAVALGLGLLASSASAQEAVAERPRTFWLTGDVRLRGDFVRDLPGGRADFERGRSFLRLGVEGVPLSWLEIGIAGKGGLGTDANRDNGRNNDNETSDSLSVDAAWLRVATFTGGGVAAGKRPLPLWLTSLVWDDDLRPIGLGVVQRIGVRDYDVLRLAGGWFRTDHLHGDDSQLAAAQTAWLFRDGAPTSGEVLVSYVHALELDELPSALFRTNTASAGRLVHAYRLLDLQLAAHVQAGRLPLAARLDLVRNLDPDTERDGLRLHVEAGDAGRPWGGALAFAYQDIGRDAVLAAWNGDDWWFHSWSRGHMLRATLGLSPRLRLRASGFTERRGGLDENTERLLVDLEWEL